MLHEAIHRLWYGGGPAVRAARLLLVPLSWVFTTLVALRVKLYRRGWLRRESVETPVVSVGNLSVGGTGKTPLVVWLALRMLDAGLHPVIVSRGYGGRARRPVILQFDAGWTLPEEFAARVFHPRSDYEAVEAAGDEAVLVSRRTGCPVIAFADRLEACRTALDCFAPDCILLDDGFQHLKLERDLDIVILGHDDLGSYRLPAGPLREGAAALSRADVVVHMDDAEGPPSMKRWAVGLVRRVDRAATLRPTAALQGKAVALVAGIAGPATFFEMVESAGATVVWSAAYRDHHAYRAEDWEHIRASALQAGAEMVVTTEKDLVKLEHLAGNDPLLHALRLEVELAGGDAIVDRIATLDARGGRHHDRRAAGSGPGDAGGRGTSSE